MWFASPTARLSLALTIAIGLHAGLLLWSHRTPHTIFLPQIPLQLFIQHPQDTRSPSSQKMHPATERPSPHTNQPRHVATAQTMPSALSSVPQEHTEPTMAPSVSNSESAHDTRTATQPNTGAGSNANAPNIGNTSAVGTTMKPAISQHASIRQRVDPIYPEEARKQNKEGIVKVKVRLSKEGTILQSAILVTSGSNSLDNALLEAISHWRFSPAIDANGQAIEESLVIPYRFQLRKDSNDE